MRCDVMSRAFTAAASSLIIGFTGVACYHVPPQRLQGLDAALLPRPMAAHVQQTPVQTPTPGPEASSPQRALINKYCLGCHNQRTKIADLQLDKADVDHPAEHGEIWEK